MSTTKVNVTTYLHPCHEHPLYFLPSNTRVTDDFRLFFCSNCGDELPDKLAIFVCATCPCRFCNECFVRPSKSNEKAKEVTEIRELPVATKTFEEVTEDSS